MRLSRSVVVLAVLACPWLATAADAPHSPSYLPPDAVDGTTLLPGPPPPGSPFALAEQETMRNVQEIRGPALVALAKRYDNISVFSLLRPVLGEWCNPETLPRTADLFERTRQDVEPCIERTKANWRRDRPYIADLALQPVVYRPSNTSYPSGHSVLAEMFAVLLSEAIPAHAPDWKR